MEEKKFVENFISYFNEHIKEENPKINSEYNLQRAKFIIVLKNFSGEEIKRCYFSLISDLHNQNLSLDYITPEMVSILKDPQQEKRKDKRVSLEIKSVSSRKPQKDIKKVTNELKDSESLEKHKSILISHFNKCYSMHINKPNTYDTFEFVLDVNELIDKELFKNRLAEESKKLEYKIYQLKPDLLKIEFINNNYLVRYFYGE